MPHYVNVASGSFYTGISETVVVVVGTKRLFVAMLLALWLCNKVEQTMCQVF
jgi:hypothetical protein